MNIAYLILCHTDPCFVNHTIETLSYEKDSFFIHVDKRVEITDFKRLIQRENVCFLEKRYSSYWGGFNAIKAIMELIRLANNSGDYDRFVLLQGQDYPLVSNAEIHSFFEEKRQIEFCKGRNISTSAKKADYIKCACFWMQDVDGVLGKAISGVLSRINNIGLKYRSKYYKGKPIYHGWAQFALTKRCVNFLLKTYDNEKSYNNYMKHRFPPDELYIPTLIHNSQFRNNVDDTIIKNRDGAETKLNLTYFEYPDQVILFTVRQKA